MQERKKRKAVPTIVAFLVLSLPFATAWGVDFYVSPAGSDSAGDGSSTAPFATIQHAIDTANSGDTVHVSSGTYTENVRMKNGVYVKGDGADRTYIQAPPFTSDTWRTSNGTYCANCHSGSSANWDNSATVMFIDVDDATLEGFYITNPYPPSCHFDTTVLFIGLAMPNIDNNVIRNSIIYNNLPTDNSCFTVEGTLGSMGSNSYRQHSAIAIYDNTTPRIINNVIYGYNGFRGILFRNSPPSTPTIKNNIILGFDNACVANPPVDLTGAFSYNDFFFNGNLSDGCGGLAASTGYLSADPLFVVNDEFTTFRLGTGSPAIDAGDPAPEYNDTNGTRNDMGAFGGAYGRATTTVIETDGTTWLSVGSSSVAEFPFTPGPGWNTELGFDTSGWHIAPLQVMDQSLCTNGACVWSTSDPFDSTDKAWFRKAFEITGPVISATLAGSADDDAQIYVNGILVHNDTNGLAQDFGPISIDPLILRQGTNLIAAHASDNYLTFGYGHSFRARLVINTQDGCSDADGDGVCDSVDNCPTDYNLDQSNKDGDLTGDVCDPCPLDASDLCASGPNADIGTVTPPDPNAVQTVGNALVEACFTLNDVPDGITQFFPPDCYNVHFEAKDVNGNPLDESCTLPQAYVFSDAPAFMNIPFGIYPLAKGTRYCVTCNIAKIFPSVTLTSPSTGNPTIYGLSAPPGERATYSVQATYANLLSAPEYPAVWVGSVKADPVQISVYNGIPVKIDVKPGDSANTVNAGSNGKIPVAILSQKDGNGNMVFDPSKVNIGSVTLNDAHVTQKVKGKSDRFMYSLDQDLNGDGVKDLVVHVDTADLHLPSESTTATVVLKGWLGTCSAAGPACPAFEGKDTLRIVPVK